MRSKRGDHVCVLYSSTAELATIVAAFRADGLRSGERSWYVASGKETDPIRAALQNINVDVTGEIARKALKLVSTGDASI